MKTVLHVLRHALCRTGIAALMALAVVSLGCSGGSTGTKETDKAKVDKSIQEQKNLSEQERKGK